MHHHANALLFFFTGLIFFFSRIEGPHKYHMSETQLQPLVLAFVHVERALLLLPGQSHTREPVSASSARTRCLSSAKSVR